MQTNLNVTFIGNINAGKSSLINALLKQEVAQTGAKGGVTTSSTSFRMRTYTIRDDSSEIKLVDTPGLSEIDGQEQSKIAYGAAEKGDLVLFVICSDLVDIEYQTIVQLHKMKKPIVLVFNQIDKYTAKQREEIEHSLRTRLNNLIDHENIVLVSASPQPQKIIRINNTGDEEVIEREGVPDVEELKNRIVHIADNLGKPIKRISSYVDFIRGKRKTKAKNKLKEIKAKATEKSFNYAVMIGVGTAMNPVPLLDLVGGAAGLGILVKEIANLHGEQISKIGAEKLAKEMLLALTALSTFTLLMIGLGALVKMIPFVGWLVGGAAQAVSIAFVVYIIGDLLNDYYANNKQWTIDNSLKKSLEQKIKATDRKEIMRRLKVRINENLKQSL